MNPQRKRPAQIDQPSLTVEEVRIIADLRVMHSKVDELHHIVKTLQSRHNNRSVIAYADDPLLAEDIRKVDEIYLWYVKLKEERDRRVAQ